MNRHVLFVLLLTTGIVLGEFRLRAEQAAGAAGAQATTGGAPEKTEAPQKAEEAPGQTGGTPAKTEEAQTQSDGAPAAVNENGTLISTPGSKALGMSILGNQEAPTSLVIVPWKSSELGDARGIPTMLDDSREPVDKDVFMRALRYYEIRSETTRHDGAKTGGRDNPVGSDAAQSVTAAPRRE